MSPLEVAETAIGFMSEDDVEELCRANDWVDIMGLDDVDDELNPVKDAYEDGECPDCGQTIPNDVSEGDACTNCGHVFTVSTDESLEP